MYISVWFMFLVSIGFCNHSFELVCTSFGWVYGCVSCFGISFSLRWVVFGVSSLFSMYLCM